MCKVIVIKGAGGRAFCAGGDVRQVVELAGSGKQNEALDFFAEEYKLNHMIATLKTPFVAILDGITSKEKNDIFRFVIVFFFVNYHVLSTGEWSMFDPFVHQKRYTFSPFLSIDVGYFIAIH